MNAQELLAYIRQEIEKRIEAHKTKNGFPAGSICAIRIKTYEELLQFLGTVALEEDPEGLDEAARLYAIPHYMKDIDREHIDEYPYDTGLEAAFKAGAEWIVGQGYSVEDRVRDLPMKYLPLWCEKADPNDKVIVQIRKK